MVIAARGTSDHAAVYAQYVLGARNGLTVALAAPSLVTLYGASPRYGNALVVGLSQSGRSPDVVGVVAAARAQGALTLAITNESDVAARVARRSTAWTWRQARSGPLRRPRPTRRSCSRWRCCLLPCSTRTGRARAGSGAGRPRPTRSTAEPEARRIAADQVGLDRAVVLGRGFGYATAREWSLKLKEVAQLWADPYTCGRLRARAGRAAGAGLRGLRRTSRQDLRAMRCSTRSGR